MRALAFVACFVGCAPTATPHVNLAPPTTTYSVATTATSAMCAAPHANTRDFLSRGMDDVLFAACDVYVPAFEKIVVESCTDAVPALAKALEGIDDSRTAEGFYTSEARGQRDARLGTAGLPKLSRACRAHFPRGIADDDWGRAMWEVDADWRTCTADAEVTAAYTIDRGATTEWPIAETPIGANLYALALAPHLTPLGRQYLRKFVVCEMIEHADASRSTR